MSDIILKLEMEQDPSDFNPRVECDNATTMLCFHSRYSLGDPQAAQRMGISHSDFDSWEEMEEFLYKEKEAELVLPLFLMDHSGLSISSRSFNDSWDSGQVGFIFIDKDSVKENWENGISKEDLKEYLLRDVEVYDQYLRGDIWYYEVENTKTGEILDSCGGFFGEESAKSEGQASLEHYRELESGEKAKEREALSKIDALLQRREEIREGEYILMAAQQEDLRLNKELLMTGTLLAISKGYGDAVKLAEKALHG